MRLQDTDKCPWGKFEGHKMEDVPATYLLFIEQQDEPLPVPMQEYIDWARGALLLEVKGR